MEKIKPTIEILDNQSTLTARALEITLSKIQTAIEERGSCTLALAGGSTPKPLYQALSNQSLPWDKIHIFWGDERYVPADHPDSNQRMAREAWLDRVNFPPTNIHPMFTTSNNPLADAQRHETELQAFFGSKAGLFPTFDLILLGIGDDGHTASLFPHTQALEVCDRLITVGNKDGQPRLTFTIPLINKARTVLFLVAGANKQTALQQIFSPEGNSHQYPARFIQPEGELWWLLDQQAGAILK